MANLVMDGVTLASKSGSTVTFKNTTMDAASITYPSGCHIQSTMNAYPGTSADGTNNYNKNSDPRTSINGLSSGTWHQMGTRHKITPLKANSKILVQCQIQSYVASGSNLFMTYFYKVTSSGTYTNVAPEISQQFGGNSSPTKLVEQSAANSWQPTHLSVVHTPSYTVGQEVYYALYYMSSAGHDAYTHGNFDLMTTILLTELAQ
tara:strand:- start:842 stop:1456 length:615 start_codon:yes stop_codon:yes gene_type:complete